MTEFIKSDSVRSILKYWYSKAAPGRLPSRQDIKLEELRDLAPQIAIVDVLAQPLQFRFRLFGTNLAALAGRDLTGMVLSEQGCDGGQTFSDYKSVVEAPQPRFDKRAAVAWLGKPYIVPMSGPSCRCRRTGKP